MNVTQMIESLVAASTEAFQPIPKAEVESGDTTTHANRVIYAESLGMVADALDRKIIEEFLALAIAIVMGMTGKLSGTRVKGAMTEFKKQYAEDFATAEGLAFPAHGEPMMKGRYLNRKTGGKKKSPTHIVSCANRLQQVCAKVAFITVAGNRPKLKGITSEAELTELYAQCQDSTRKGRNAIVSELSAPEGYKWRSDYTPKSEAVLEALLALREALIKDGAFEAVEDKAA